MITVHSKTVNGIVVKLMEGSIALYIGGRRYPSFLVTTDEGYMEGFDSYWNARNKYDSINS